MNAFVKTVLIIAVCRAEAAAIREQLGSSLSAYVLSGICAVAILLKDIVVLDSFYPKMSQSANRRRCRSFFLNDSGPAFLEKPFHIIGMGSRLQVGSSAQVLFWVCAVLVVQCVLIDVFSVPVF